MKPLEHSAGRRARPKYDVQGCNEAKYWATWVSDGRRRTVMRSDGVISVDKTAGAHSRPTAKLVLRNANRALTKSARRSLSQQLARMIGEELDEGQSSPQESGS